MIACLQGANSGNKPKLSSLKSIITLKKLVNHPDLIHDKVDDVPEARAVVAKHYGSCGDPARAKLQPGLSGMKLLK